MLAVEMGHDEFTASNGWLHSFQKRHNIKQAVLSGEAADVQQTTVDDWCQRLPTIYQGYSIGHYQSVPWLPRVMTAMVERRQKTGSQFYLCVQLLEKS